MCIMKLASSDSYDIVSAFQKINSKESSTTHIILSVFFFFRFTTKARNNSKSTMPDMRQTTKTTIGCILVIFRNTSNKFDDSVLMLIEIENFYEMNYTWVAQEPYIRRASMACRMMRVEERRAMARVSCERSLSNKR